MLMDIIYITLTIFGIVLAIFLVNWLDRNVFSKHKNFKKDKNND